MATVGTTTSQTIVSLLGTLNSTANMVARTVDSAASSVDMLDAYVQRAKRNQTDQHKVEDLHWRRNLILDAAKEQEKKENAIIKEYAHDTSRQQKFNNITEQLEALFTQPTN